jgi:hypothetical protein
MRPDPFVVTVPASVAYNLDKFQNVIAELFDKIGCGNCFSGKNILINTERNFVADELAKVSARIGTRALPQDPVPVLPSDPFPMQVVVPDGVAGDIKQVRELIAIIAKQNGCDLCSSGVSVLFRNTLRTIVFDRAGKELHAQTYGKF